MNFVKTMDELPLIVKIILAIPALDIIWVVYRLVKSLNKKSTIGVVLALVLLFFGWPFLWLLDIIFIVLRGQVLWVD